MKKGGGVIRPDREVLLDNSLQIIGYIRNDFRDKFGIPRQSGLVEQLHSTIVMEKEFRNPEAFRGITEYSHIWLLWGFSQAKRKEGVLTVRPPRLGGNQRMGVFATRSPFRPNGIGLSSVRLLSVMQDAELGVVLHVAGADLLSGTPIYDIKPYLPFTDSHPEAVGGFSDVYKEYHLQVDFPNELLVEIPGEKREALLGILAQDPRPAYHNDPKREYGLDFADYRLCFRVEEDCLHVTRVERIG